jgi:chemotaxis signal transduction protein
MSPILNPLASDFLPEFVNQDLSSFAAPRQIVTRVDQNRLVFPKEWVVEVLLIKQSQVLHLPFYDSSVLGVVHYQGGVMPLIGAQQILSVIERPVQTLRETLTVIRLSDTVPGLVGVGILVDQVIGQETNLGQDSSPEDLEKTDAWIWFDPNMITAQQWQPQR